MPIIDLFERGLSPTSNSALPKTPVTMKWVDNILTKDKVTNVVRIFYAISATYQLPPSYREMDGLASRLLRLENRTICIHFLHFLHLPDMILPFGWFVEQKARYPISWQMTTFLGKIEMPQSHHRPSLALVPAPKCHLVLSCNLVWSLCLRPSGRHPDRISMIPNCLPTLHRYGAICRRGLLLIFVYQNKRYYKWGI